MCKSWKPYMECLRQLYCSIESSKVTLKRRVSKFNLNDACVANRIVKKKQQTVRSHVDDLMSSHINPKVYKDFRYLKAVTYTTCCPIIFRRGHSMAFQPAQSVSFKPAISKMNGSKSIHQKIHKLIKQIERMALNLAYKDPCICYRECVKLIKFMSNRFRKFVKSLKFQGFL